MNFRISFFTAALTISSFLTPGADAALIYDLVNYPAEQNGHSLSGTITTTDAAPDDGQLMVTEILSWEIEIVGPSGFSGAMSDVNSNTIATGVTITPTQIILPYPTVGETNDLQLYIENNAAHLGYVRVHEPFGAGFFSLYRANRPAGPDAWYVQEPLMNNSPPNHGTAPWIVATRVPEPSSFILVCSLMSAIFFRRSLRTLARSVRQR